VRGLLIRGAGTWDGCEQLFACVGEYHAAVGVD
jgi:hypothetical protein